MWILQVIQSALFGMLGKLKRKKREMNIKEQLDYIDSFPQPSDDFERVFFQYKAHTVELSRISVSLLNIIANCLIPFFIIYFLLNKLCVQEIIEKKSAALVIWYPNKRGMKYDYSDIIPCDDLIEEFGDIYSLKLASWAERLKGVWGKDAFLIWRKLFCRYPLCGYMNLSCMIQLMYINKLISFYDPRIILEARRDEAYASTLVTLFCESLNKEYALFMHGFISGDKVYSFVRFSRIYVWDSYFIKVYIKVHAKANRFYIYFPKIFMAQAIDKESKRLPVDFIYYLSDENLPGMHENSNEILAKIYAELMILIEYGNTVRVRPHPRWSDINKVITVFSASGIEVEDTGVTTINESLDGCKCAIGSFSTVLLQAYYRGIPIVIDDVSSPSVFNEIKQRDAFFLHLPHRLFSEIIRRRNIQ